MPVDMVGVRLPSEIIKIIDMDIQEGEYISRSDWVRCACREFYEKRKRERLGGGALTHDRAVRRFKKIGVHRAAARRAAARRAPPNLITAPRAVFYALFYTLLGIKSWGFT